MPDTDAGEGNNELITVKLRYAKFGVSCRNFDALNSRQGDTTKTMWTPVNEEEFQAFCLALKRNGGYETAGDERPVPCCPTLRFYWLFFDNMMSHYWAQRRVGGIAYVQRGGYGLLRICERLGGRVSIQGLEHLEDLPNTPILVANHMSLLETCLLPMICTPYFELTYILKASLGKYPFFGKFVRDLHPVFVTRKHPRRDMEMAMEQGIEAIRNQRAIIVFPQGTRTTVLDNKRFSSLPFRMAKAAQTCIVPVAVQTDFIGNGRILKDIGTIAPQRPIRFRFLPPITSENVNTLKQEAFSRIAEVLREWGLAVRDGS